MPSTGFGFRLWPGSLISGASVADGQDATGVVTAWDPDLPIPGETVAADDTVIDLQGLSKQTDAIEIMAFAGGAAAATLSLEVVVWLALLFPVVGGGSAYIPNIVQLTWTCGDATMKAWSDFGVLPEGAKSLSGPTSAITNYFRPPCYPLDNIPRDGSNIAIAGYARDLVLETGEANLLGSAYTIPHGGAEKAIYRVGGFSPTGAAWNLPTFNMLYQLRANA